jgi:feruloyl esterase
MQLYLIPGMSHCGGGARVNRVDFLPALIDWVEKDLKPDNLSGSRVIDGNIEYQQGLYPYSININLE